MDKNIMKNKMLKDINYYNQLLNGYREYIDFTEGERLIELLRNKYKIDSKEYNILYDRIIKYMTKLSYKKYDIDTLINFYCD